MYVSLIHEPVTASAMQGFISFIFLSQADTEIGRMLDDNGKKKKERKRKNATATRKDRCGRSANSTVGWKWNVPGTKNEYQWKGNDLAQFRRHRCGVWGGKRRL